MLNGLILHLIPWRPHFQPAFERLSTATIWIQLHHLPWDYWNLTSMESIASFFGRVIKIDETTMIYDRGRFARICIEIDLDKPLKRGIWVKLEEKYNFVALIYEKIPMFCYQCGVVGHGAENCKMGQAGNQRMKFRTKTSFLDLKGKEAMAVDVGPSCRNSEVPEETLNQETQKQNPGYGIWMTQKGKRGKGRVA
ncbi:hypothetical protein J5N97_028355 [Dioscorea zingiberensis]|uniref:CCHC-type domain-containing protein n=1 Tax=Dioscorea zingiberensis TaxID=325984 RepID=A0A9D5BYV0_9LILI|nr:hypothetical protein J5N97_028355 [Dioscorea zingiberensis]